MALSFGEALRIAYGEGGEKAALRRRAWREGMYIARIDRTMVGSLTDDDYVKYVVDGDESQLRCDLQRDMSFLCKTSMDAFLGGANLDPWWPTPEDITAEDYVVSCGLTYEEAIGQLRAGERVARITWLDKESVSGKSHLRLQKSVDVKGKVFESIVCVMRDGVIALWQPTLSDKSGNMWGIVSRETRLVEEKIEEKRKPVLLGTSNEIENHPVDGRSPLIGNGTLTF